MIKRALILTLVSVFFLAVASGWAAEQKTVTIDKAHHEKMMKDIKGMQDRIKAMKGEMKKLDTEMEKMHEMSQSLEKDLQKIYGP